MSRARDLADSADKDIAGTLTVDAITSSGDISLADNAKAIFGASSDLQIYHDGQSRIKDAGSGHLILMADADVRITDSTGNETKASFVTDGAVNLSHNGNTKFSTTSTGIDVTGEIQGDSLDIDGVADFTGKTTHRGGISLLDNDVLTIGTNDDLQIYHSGADSFIKDIGTGDLNIMAADNLRLMDINSENWLYAAQNGEVRLYYDAAEKFRTTSSGVQVTGSVVTDRLVIEDDGSAQPLLELMADDQSPWALRIGNSTYSTGNHGILSYVGNTGGGIIQSQGNGAYQSLTFNQSDDSLVRAMMQMNATGSVRLFYQGNEKLYTKSDGIDVTGEVQADSLDIDGTADISGQVNFHSNVVMDDNNILYLGNGTDLRLYHDGSNSWIRDTGTGNLYIQGSSAVHIRGENSEFLASFGENSATTLYWDNNTRLTTTNTGATLNGTLAADGLSLGDNESAYFGAGNDLRIYHDGSNSYITDAGTGDLILTSSTAHRVRTEQFQINNAANTEQMISAVANGAVTLRYDGSAKLATTSGGISVTGTVAATSFTGDGSALTGISGGKVLQVVEGTSTSTTSTSSTSFVNTAISTSITPSSTSSKILVIVSAPTESQTNTNVGSGDQTLGLFRGSTEIATTNIGTREANGFFDYVQGGTSMQRLDSPSTTSSTTYTVKIKSNHSSTTIRCPSNSRVGSIILMEIGA